MVVCLAGGVALVQVLLSARYGYNVDELYYRLLGNRGFAWGYTDQPPLTPAVVRSSIVLFGDTVVAVRVPAALCAAAVVVLGAMITAELGGSPRARVFAALGLSTSFLVLSVGHVMVTTTLDVVAWCAVLLFVVRALVRGDDRWWVAAGAVCGIASYAKYVVLLLPVSLVVALALVGPRRMLVDRRFLAGVAVALLLGAPNLVYQVVNDFPQLRMAEALGATDGSFNRVIFLPTLLLVLGPLAAVVCVAGCVRLLRDRAVRAVGVAALVALVLTVVGGGRPDYVGGVLIGLFAAGCVALDRWSGRGRRIAPLAVAFAGTSALQVVLALPVLPERALSAVPVNNISTESVGWPELAEGVTRAYRSLPPGERHRAVVLAHNIGEAGALDRFGQDLPTVHSGHNELHSWGPPPEHADVVVAVGFTDDRLTSDFHRCDVVDHVDNGVGLDNAEQGMPITVCRGRSEPWAQSWPAYHYLSG